MLQALPRGDFLRLVVLQDSNFDQRLRFGQVPLAFACETTARHGLYLYLDALLTFTASMLSGLSPPHVCKLELKPAADALRANFPAWLDAMTKAERSPTPEQFFAVFTMADRTNRVIVGTKEESMMTLYGFDQVPLNVSIVSLQGVLRQLRTQAASAKIVLPERFTVAEREPGYENWLGEIKAYQARARARAKGRIKKAKAKKRAT